MAVLADLLSRRHPGLRLVNLSVPGEMTETMLSSGGQLERAERAVAEAISDGEQVAPLTLSIGGNDAMFGGFGRSEASRRRVRRNLDEIVDRLAASLAPSQTTLSQVACLQTVYNPFEATPTNGDGSAAPRGTGINSVLRAVAERAGIRVAEVSRAFRHRAAELTWIESGDIHPKIAGHRAIAEAYLRAGGWSA